MEIKPRLIEFLNKYQDLINANDFDRVYELINRYEWNKDIKPSDLTVLLNNAGIDPMPYFNHTLPKYYFAHSEITKVTIPDNIINIEYHAFSGCTNLTSIKLPSKLEYIGDGVFEMCDSLKYVKLPDSVNYIGQELFDSCENLEQVELSKSLRAIPPWAFNWCMGLKEFEIPDNIVTIGQRAFSKCDNLETIIIGKGVKYIEIWAIPGGPDGSSKIKNVIYKGTMDEWTKIVNKVKFRIDIHCSDGIIHNV